MTEGFSLQEGMAQLVTKLRMLTGLCVVYGNEREHGVQRLGLAQEVMQAEDGGFVACQRPLHERSLYDLASLTKLFTAVAVLQLVERGRLSLDDRMGDKDGRFPWLRDTSLYDLLTYQAVLRTPERVDAQPDRASALRQVFQIRRLDGPEPPKLYSDMHALVLKHLVEELSGRSFYDYLSAEVFTPSGMVETYSQVPEDRLADCLCYNYEHRIIHGEHVLITDAVPGLPHDPKARLLCDHGRDLQGHAGLFSTADDMARFAQALLRGELLHRDLLLQLGRNRTGQFGQGQRYRQYLGYLCFAKSADQHLSELPPWMDQRSFGFSGYTGNHIAIDPERMAFDIFLGNRCHNRLSMIEPRSDAARYPLADDGAGQLRWPDGRSVQSSFLYQYQKDRLLHQPVEQELLQRGWMI